MRAALWVLCCAGAAGAWEGHRAPDGQLQRWWFASKQPLQVRLIEPPAGLVLKPRSDLRIALTRAAEAWQAVEAAHVPVRYLGQIAARGPRPGEVLVSFDTGPGFVGGHDAAGFTELTLQGHFILAAHVHLNAGEFRWATDGSADALDVQSIAEHEIGHALGLAHPCGDTDTNTPSCLALPPTEFQALSLDVMFPSIPAGPRRELTQDDALGMATLLPVPDGRELAPHPLALIPSCLQTEPMGPGVSQNVQISLLQPQTDLTALELLEGDAVVGEAPLSRDAGHHLWARVPPEALRAVAVLDGRLVARSGKAGVLFGALEVATSCHRHGCGSGGAPSLALLPLALFALRRKKKNNYFFPALVVLLAATPAFAYVRTVNNGGVCIWWATRGHSFQIDAQGTPDVPGLAAFTAIRKSFQTWAGVACSDLSFPDLGLSQDPRDRVVGYFPGQHNANLVLFRTRSCPQVVPPSDGCLKQGGCGNTYDCWDHGDGAIATTTTTSNLFTGQIEDSDTEMNDAPHADGSARFVFTAVDGLPCTDPNQTGCVQFDVQNTMTHEAGHSLGLAHTLDPHATMYATAPYGETSKRVLGSDDIQAICDIYPKGARTVTCLNDPITLTGTGASNGGCGCSHAQTGPGAALGALALLLQMKRRSRRKPQLAINTRSAKARPSLPGSGRIS